MEKAQLDKLLKVATKEEQLQLKIYYNASIQTLKAYKDDPTAARLKDLQAAESALEEYASKLEKKLEKESLPPPKVFPNRLAVTRYLQAEGWQVSKSTIYNKFGRAKFKPRKDGLFYQEDIDKAASVCLKRKATIKQLQDTEDDLQRKKVLLEIEKLEIANARAKHMKEVEEGAYIPIADLEIELASRAAVFDAGLSHFFQSEAGAWINLVEGNQKKLPELLAVLMAKKDELLNQYAQAKEFTVEFGEQK